MKQEIIEKIADILPAEQIFRQEPMERHTTFRVGGPAALFLEITSEEQLQKLIAFFYETGTEYFVIGNGSNLLVDDNGYDGVILHIAEGMSKIRIEGEKIIAQSGALLPHVARTALTYSLTGLEFACGIPGSTGGGVIMNAGAYGGEMSQIVSRVSVILKDGTREEYAKETLRFGYRTSLMKQNGAVVTEVVFSLKSGEKQEISAKMADYAERRKKKQPLEYPSAGSTFKRPKGYFAGKLIMDAGLQGYGRGGAQVSEKHCGFVINKGGATAADIRGLMKEIQEKVKTQFGVQLEPEVIWLGKNGEKF